jgi:hypothetical protein
MVTTKSLSQRNRASQVRELWAKLSGHERKRLDCRRDDAVQVARKLSSRQLVKQAGSILCADASFDLAVLDSAEVDGIEGTVGSVSTEEDGVLEVHGDNLVGDIHVRVWGDASGPVVGDLLVDEKRLDGCIVGLVAVGARWHELVEEAGSSVKQKGQRPEEEVGVLSLWRKSV